MAKIFSLMSRLYGEIKKNGVSNTYYKVIEKQAKNEAQKDYEEKRVAALPTEEELEAMRQEKLQLQREKASNFRYALGNKLLGEEGYKKLKSLLKRQ